MELKQLEYFKVSAETGSFGKASDLLYINQSNISRSVKSLEEELGIQLFVRNTRGIFLTLEGERVYEKATEILNRCNSLGPFVPRTGQSTFSVSTFPSNYLAYLFANIDLNHPECRDRLRLISCGTSETLRQVAEHVADIGFIYSSEYQYGKLKHVLNKHNLQYVPVYHAMPVVYLGKRNTLPDNRERALELLPKQEFFKVDYDYRENYHDLLNTAREYHMEEQLERAGIVDGGYGITQMLNYSDRCYLGHVWMNDAEDAIISNPEDKGIFTRFIPLESKDGRITMGFVHRRSEPLHHCVEGLIQDLHTFFVPLPMRFTQDTSC